MSCQILACPANLTHESDYCGTLQPKNEADNFDEKKMNLMSLIPMVYGIPTCIISGVVICILMSKKGRNEFKGSFYKAVAFANLIVSFWLINLPKGS